MRAWIPKGNSALDKQTAGVQKLSKADLRRENKTMKNYKIAVAGTGYVGLSLGVLFAQHHQVVAVDIVQAKVDMINNKKSPIQDDYIEEYLAEKDLNLTATLDAKAAYSDADFVVVAAPTNVYSTNRIDVASSKRTCFAHYMGH